MLLDSHKVCLPTFTMFILAKVEEEQHQDRYDSTGLNDIRLHLHIDSITYRFQSPIFPDQTPPFYITVTRACCLIRQSNSWGISLALNFKVSLVVEKNIFKKCGDRTGNYHYIKSDNK